MSIDERKIEEFIYELPQESDIEGMEWEHICVNIADIFPNKFYDISYSYVRKLEEVLVHYDVVIFMARKAICFFKALLLNGVITNEYSCEVYSSRILSYNVWDELSGKIVALVDDVVIHGSSVNDARQNLLKHGIIADIYISAWMDNDFEKDERGQNLSDLREDLQEPFVYLDETDIYSYANYITRYIEASMLPYNIDQPTVLVEYGSEELDDFLHEHRLTDITSTVQKKYGIENKVIHYSGEILRPILGRVNINLDEICIKLRIFHDLDSHQLMIFPIILFPIISAKTIDHIYSYIQTEKLDEFIWNENKAVIEENRTKVLIYAVNHYILSRFLWCERVHGRDFKYVWVDSNEKILFSKSLLNSDYVKNTLIEKISDLQMPYKLEQKTQVRQLFFNEYLGAAYVMIFGDINCSEGEKQSFFDAKGNLISKKVITYQCLYEKLRKYAFSKQKNDEAEQKNNEVDFCIVSNIIDVLIDRGMLVPILVHTQDDSIVRAYRCGEVARLTDKEFDLFSYMLARYASFKWENGDLIEKNVESDKHIGKIEAEQLCVLFFRNAAKKKLFGSLYDEIDGTDDAYSVYYSVFGPLVSKAKGKEYEVGKKESLFDNLVEYGLVHNLNRDEYVIDEKDYSELTDGWKREANIFSDDMTFLQYCFPTPEEREAFFVLQNKKKDKTDEEKLKRNVLSKVRTFEQLLTIMSIGENEMQRTLSIIAEIKVIADMNTERPQSAMNYFKNNMECIREGMWKGRCYVRDDSLFCVQEMLKQGRSSRDCRDIEKIFATHVEGSGRVDRNTGIEKFLSDCGTFFYKTYYTLLSINEHSQRINLEEKCSIPDRLKFERRYKKLRHQILNEYNACPTNKIEEKSRKDLRDLKREANAMLDICDLYLKQKAFDYKICYHTLIICANNPDILKELQISSSSCNYNQSRTGKVGVKKTRFFRCFRIVDDKNYEKDKISKRLTEDIDMLMTKFSEMEDKQIIEDSEITLIYHSARVWYEAMIYSGYDATGRFIEKIVRDVTKKEKLNGRGELEFFVCKVTEKLPLELKSQLFRLEKKGETVAIQNNYFLSNYDIHFLTSRKHRGETSIYGDVGAIIENGSNAKIENHN